MTWRTGLASGSGTASGTNTGDQFTATAAGVLIGRGSGSAGAAEEIAVGSGLTLAGTTLSAAGGTGDVVGPASAVDGRVALFDGTSGKLLKVAAGALNAAGVGLGSVTNDAQTKAAIVPNTAPAAGQLLVGNAGGTAYAPVAASGDVTLASTGALTIANDAVTFAKMQNVSAASKLLGRGDSGSGDPQEITLGTNLAMSGTTLNATAGSGASLVSAFLTATQTNSTTTPAVLTGHTFTLTPGQTLSLTGQMIFTADALTTGGCLGVRVAQAATADAHAIGSVAMQVAVTGAQGNTQLFDGDAFDVAAAGSSFFEIVGTATTAANVAAAYQLSIKNLSSNVNTTVTIEFRSEIATSVVTAQIGTGCTGVKA